MDMVPGLDLVSQSKQKPISGELTGSKELDQGPMPVLWDVGYLYQFDADDAG